MIQIDLNCDLGEGSGCDEQLMPLITSANIACRGHAGDDASMRAAIGLARQHGVMIGAHPSYPDKANFGRVAMDLSVEVIRREVEMQIRALAGIAETQGVQLHHVKPHGALYNAAAQHQAVAQAVVEAVLRVDRKLILVGLSGSVLIDVAGQTQLRVARECFADRTYQEDGTLTPRSQAGAVIEDPQKSLAQAVDIVTRHQVATIAGKRISIFADTICVHGDGPKAVQLLKTLCAGLGQAGVDFRAF